MTSVALSDQEALVTVRASKFWTRCNLSRLRFEAPYSSYTMCGGCQLNTCLEH